MARSMAKFVLLAFLEARDRLTALRWRKSQARDQFFGGGDFRFGDAAVGFGDGAGKAEQGADERVGWARLRAPRRALIPQMAQHEADQ